MRTGWLVAVAVLVLLASGCASKRASLLDAQRSAAAEHGPTSAPAPQGTWRLADSAPTTPGVLRDVVAVDATHAWAVGQDGTTGMPMVQEWDGMSWTRTELPVTWRGELRLVAADAPDNVWAAGAATGPDPNRVLHYDGTAWAEVPFPPGNARVTDLAVAGGHTWLIGTQGGRVLIHEFDGTAWQQRKPPAECTQGGTSFGGIPTFCDYTGIVAFAADDAWVAGNAAWPGFKGPLLFHWDGTAWTAVRVGLDNADTAFSEIAGTPTDLWAVGHRDGYGGPVAVHGDGKKWTVVDGLPTARLTDVAVDAAGRPWVLANFTAPKATLATYRGGRWVDTPAPDVTGASLHGITAIPGADGMFAVGEAEENTVLLRYGP